MVVETDYLCRPQDVALIPGAAEVIGAANRSGFPVVIVTNQAGIGRGKFGWADFAAVQETIASALAGLQRAGYPRSLVPVSGALRFAGSQSDC